jgi:hypothetical protein
MAPPQHLLAEIHQLRDRVPPIPDILLNLAGDETDGFRAVQDQSPGQAPLRKLADGRDEELVLRVSSAFCRSMAGSLPVLWAGGAFSNMPVKEQGDYMHLLQEYTADMCVMLKYGGTAGTSQAPISGGPPIIFRHGGRWLIRTFQSSTNLEHACSSDTALQPHSKSAEVVRTKAATEAGRQV